MGLLDSGLGGVLRAGQQHGSGALIQIIAAMRANRGPGGGAGAAESASGSGPVPWSNISSAAAWEMR